MSLAWTDSLFAPDVGPRPAHLHVLGGDRLALDVNRWHRTSTFDDQVALSRAVGPVLDIGCGPGRHTKGVLERGDEVLGIDISPAAVRAARRRGAPAVVASVWDPFLPVGYWETALLLDGNIGIGGDPVALLRRTGQLLTGAKRVIIELVGGPLAGRLTVRVQHAGRSGPWFPWALVTPDSVDDVVSAAAMAVDDIWASASGRWFAVLCDPTAPSEGRGLVTGPPA